MKICPKCNKEHTKEGKFCSRSCANSRIKSDESKKKVSEKLKYYYQIHDQLNKGKSKKVWRKCESCENTFLVYPQSIRRYCSSKCNPNTGGYREGSGRSKAGYYKGIYCGSTYELAWVIYQIDHNIPFERFSGRLEYNGKIYYPDFLQNKKIVEIKGYEPQDRVDIKNEVAKQNGYDVIVLRKEDLTKEFNWVRTKYTKEFHTLYDDYKPEYHYVCDYCKNEFSANHRRKTKEKFCSKICCIRSNQKKRHSKAGVQVSSAIPIQYPSVAEWFRHSTDN